MKKTKILSLLLILVMLFTTLSPVFAQQSDDAGSARKEAFNKALKEQNIEEMVKNMTIEEKIAQTFMMDFRYWQDGDEQKNLEVLPGGLAKLIQKYRFGSIILFDPNFKTTKQIFQLTRDMQKTATTNGGIPLIIATDQEGGVTSRLNSGTALPDNMAVAATGNIENGKKIGQVIGKELSSVGINTTLAPVMDVNSNAQNPVIGVRSFSDDPDTVGQFGIAEIEGLSQGGVIGCVKHFPGHGDTAVDSHTGLPIIDRSLDELKITELVPFKQVIDSGIEMIMTAHILYPQIDDTEIFSQKLQKNVKRPATLSHKIITDILKNEMGFGGVVITDGMSMQGISDRFNDDQAIIEALKAGVDMICNTEFSIYMETETEQRIETLINSVKASVESDATDSLSMERLNDAVTRILTLKKNRGILDYDPDAYTVKEALNTVGNAEHRALEREIAAQGVTVVKNDHDTLPYKVKENDKVLMVCPESTNNPLPASMLMGWNRAKAAGLIPDSAEVRYHVFTDNACTIEGDFQEALDWADAVIVISEMDTGYLVTCPQAVVNYCKEKGKKSIVMSVCEPYDAQLFPNGDAVVITYGYKGSRIDPDKVLKKGITETTEAVGPNVIAGIEVILGVFGASGKLPLDIPRYDEKIETYDYGDIVYQRGYGLTYKALLQQEEKDDFADESSVATSLFDTNDIGALVVGICILLALIMIVVLCDRKRNHH